VVAAALNVPESEVAAFAAANPELERVEGGEVVFARNGENEARPEKAREGPFSM
jgi:hypothetical protein